MPDNRKRERTSSPDTLEPGSTPPLKKSSATTSSSGTDASAATSTRRQGILKRRDDSPTGLHFASRVTNHPGKVQVTSPLRKVTFVDELDQTGPLTLTREHVAKLVKLVERLKTTPNLKAWYRIRLDFVKDFPGMAEVKPSKLMELFANFRKEDYSDPECDITDSPEPMDRMTASDEEREELYAPGTPRSTYVSRRGT